MRSRPPSILLLNLFSRQFSVPLSYSSIGRMWGNWTPISWLTVRHINHYATHPILYWVRDLNSSLQIESLMNWPSILTQYLCTPYRNWTYILSLEDSCTIHCTKRASSLLLVTPIRLELMLQEPKSCVTTITPDSNIKEKGILLNTMV